jgi:hypothetical protein
MSDAIMARAVYADGSRTNLTSITNGGDFTFTAPRDGIIAGYELWHPLFVRPIPAEVTGGATEVKAGYTVTVTGVRMDACAVEEGP